jgi:hypothetical protein
MSDPYYVDPDAEYDAWVDRQANEPPQWWIDQQVEAWEREMQARNDGDHE